jgi:hypothetical protein
MVQTIYDYYPFGMLHFGTSTSSVTELRGHSLALSVIEPAEMNGMEKVLITIMQ